MSLILALVPIAIAIAGMVTVREQGSEVDSYLIDTPMKNDRILEQALRDYGCKKVTVGQQVDATLETANIAFERNQQGAFMARFTGPIPEEQAKTFIEDLYQLYTQKVQQEVYQKLLAGAAERGLQLQSEEIQDDKSVVLTFAM